jgi:hypothetical protein
MRSARREAACGPAETTMKTFERRAVLTGLAAFGVTSAVGCASAPGGRMNSDARSIVWTFDNLASVGGNPVRVEGAPTLIDSPYGKAVRFDGVDDALFIDNHPLAGAQTFTFEALFRPDGGAFEQRWLHLQADDAAGSDGQPTGTPGTRFLFEIRVVEQQWYLDAFVKGPGYNQTLIAEDKRFPLGRWHHVAQTYDGRMYRSYVDGVLQAEAAIAFQPQGPGRASVGCRLNRVNYFNGAVREARFTPRALGPAGFTRA